MKMKNQKIINKEMRKILVDWMYEVAIEFKLSSNTFRYAVSLLDIAISKNDDIKKKDFQLWGLVCLSISSKLIEVYAPEMKDFEIISDRTYSMSTIIEQELLFLKSIDYKVYCFSELNKECISQFAKDNFNVDSLSWKSVEYGLDLIKMEFLEDSYEDKCKSIFAFACELENNDLKTELTDSQQRIVSLLNEGHQTQKEKGKYKIMYKSHYNASS